MESITLTCISPAGIKRHTSTEGQLLLHDEFEDGNDRDDFDTTLSAWRHFAAEVVGIGVISAEVSSRIAASVLSDIEQLNSAAEYVAAEAKREVQVEWHSAVTAHELSAAHASAFVELEDLTRYAVVQRELRFAESVANVVADLITPIANASTNERVGTETAVDTEETDAEAEREPVVLQCIPPVALGLEDHAQLTRDNSSSVLAELQRWKYAVEDIIGAADPGEASCFTQNLFFDVFDLARAAAEVGASGKPITVVSKPGQYIDEVVGILVRMGRDDRVNDIDLGTPFTLAESAEAMLKQSSNWTAPEHGTGPSDVATRAA